MRNLILGVGFLTALLLPMQTLLAQEAATAEQLLAAAILNGDDNPNNDVADPTTLSANNATSIISAAPAAAVQSAIASVAQSNPGIAAQVAAVAAGNNNGISVNDAAVAAGVSPTAVFQAAASGVVQSISSSGTGTGTGASAGGGAPSVEDIEAALQENPKLIGDILPGLSAADINLLIEVIIERETLAQAAAS